MRVSLTAVALAVCFSAAAPSAAQDVMRGHGGPVRALAIKAGERELVSASFDSTVIVWDLERGTAKRVLRFHDGPVNAVAVLDDGCIVSAGEDKRVAIWCGDDTTPQRVLTGHEAPITAIAASGNRIATGGIDGVVRIHARDQPAAVETLQQHQGAVHALAAILDGRGAGMGFASAGADQTIRLFAPGLDDRIQLTGPVTALATTRGGMVAAGADGRVRLFDAGREAAEIELEGTPLSSLALSPDGKLVATAGLRGGVTIIDRVSRKVMHTLTGPGLPVWSLAFDADSRTLISGGADRVVRRWDAVAGKAITSTLPERDVVAEAVKSGERGAVVFRACQACHTLAPDDGNRAGPTLHGVMGRKIGTARGYNYSEALPRMGVVWSKETIARLFEVGPNAYTPGTKMPEQTITDPADRHALVEWLDKVTR